MDRTPRASSDDDRGQSGIGTLVVFIAVILVAMIAATVLIDTAGTLQIQASETSSESHDVVASQLEIVYAGGVVDEDGEYVEDLELTIKNGGTDPVDLTSVTIQYTSASTSRTLSYDENGADGGHFGTESLTGDSGEILTDQNDRVLLTIDTTELEDANGLEAGESATLRLVDGAGGQTTYRVSVPRTLENEGIVEV